jgi:hypothetical protein
MDLIGHKNGPGIAASVILLNLIDALVQNDALPANTKARVLAISKAQIEQWGTTNIAVQDAVAVLDKLIGLRP